MLRVKYFTHWNLATVYPGALQLTANINPLTHTVVICVQL